MSDKKTSDAADQWLKAVDEQRYSDSWQATAEHFRNSVTAESWEAQITDVRNNTGRLQARTLSSSTLIQDLPNAPAGSYIVREYASEFSVCGAIGERLTLMIEADGEPRVVGYYLI